MQPVAQENANTYCARRRDAHNAWGTACICMATHVCWACARFFNMLFLLFCIQHAFILSDPIIHVKVSLGQLPSEVSLLPQSWSQLGSPVCITRCAFAFVCISLFDVYPECVCVCVFVFMAQYVLLWPVSRGVCVCVCGCSVSFWDWYTWPQYSKCLWWNTAWDKSLRHKMVHKSSTMWSNHLLIYSSQTGGTDW